MESSYNQVNATSKIRLRLKNFTRVVSALAVSRSLARFCRRKQKHLPLALRAWGKFWARPVGKSTSSLWTDRDNGPYVLNALNVVIVKVATSSPAPQPVFFFFFARLGAKLISFFFLAQHLWGKLRDREMNPKRLNYFLLGVVSHVIISRKGFSSCRGSFLVFVHR